MNRARAFSIHLVISLLVGLILLSLLWFVWYPSPMLTAIGGHEILLLIVGIDVFIGPLLTLVVFKSGKHSLKFDLTTIALLQITALIYGTSTLWEARPAYVAALGDTFQVVQSTEVTDENLAKGKTRLPWFAPTWVGTKAPEDRYDIDAVRDVSAVGGGRGHFPQLHVPYDSMKLQVLAQAKPISKLKTVNPGSIELIDTWLASKGFDENSAKYQPIKISASVYAVILDTKSGNVVGISPFKGY